MKNKNSLQNESRQQNDINVRAGPRGIERVKVEAPVRPLEKWAGSRGKEAGGERKKERKRTDACDLCLAPWGISATDNLIEAGA